jgi:catechol 2,3-dioxygenase-like lactoylglutathione lyase family enzyme
MSDLINGVDFVTLPTKDLEKAMEFYSDVLGLRLGKRYERAPGAEFETGNLTIQLLDAEAVGMDYNPNANPVAFHVDDFEAARSELESRGVSFGGQMDSGVCHMAFFADPDGNALMIHHRYAPPEVK